MTTAEALYTRVSALLGAERVWRDDAQTLAYAIEAQRPQLVAQPETVEQAAALLALAGRERAPVVPWGQGTQMHLGRAPRHYAIALSLARLTRVVDYDSANLTLVAEAGLPIQQVHALTTTQRQFLPLGSVSTQASVGGLLVTNTSGSKRLRYGGVRDLLLGVRVALPDGACVRFGGRVVKNVAGYDMNKLFLGSLGAFGVVLEATYRLAALPEDDCVLAVVFPSLAHAQAATAALRATPLLPSAMLLLHPHVAMTWAMTRALDVQEPQVLLLLNYDGMRETVARQLNTARTVCQRADSVHDTVLSGPSLHSLWEEHEAWCMRPPTSATLGLRLGVLPTRLADALTCLAPVPDGYQTSLPWLADLGFGQIWVRLACPPVLTPPHVHALHAWLHTLRTRLRAYHGYAVVEWAPPALRAHLDLWGDVPGRALLQRYKRLFDPHALLNPGRYVTDL